MLKNIAGSLLSKLFGDGIGAEIAGRGTVYLADGLRQAVQRDETTLTTVRIQPGETYTVIARPKATRRERRAAKRAAAAESRLRSVSRPSRRQLRSARKLSRTQRRLDRRRPGSRRYRRAEAAELRRGDRFDRLNQPTRRQVAAQDAYVAAETELRTLRDASFDKARSRRRPRRSDKVYG